MSGAPGRTPPQIPRTSGQPPLGEQLLIPAASEATRTLAVKAAYEASRLIASPGELHVARVVGQIRSTAIDLLRGSGLDLAEAQRALETAGG
jgi:hypothetical protein